MKEGSSNSILWEQSDGIKESLYLFCIIMAQEKDPYLMIAIQHPDKLTYMYVTPPHLNQNGT